MTFALARCFVALSQARANIWTGAPVTLASVYVPVHLHVHFGVGVCASFPRSFSPLPSVASFSNVPSIPCRSDCRRRGPPSTTWTIRGSWCLGRHAKNRYVMSLTKVRHWHRPSSWCTAAAQDARSLRTFKIHFARNGVYCFLNLALNFPSGADLRRALAHRFKNGCAIS